MKRAFLASLFVFIAATSLRANDYWLTVAGSVNNFRTDVRVFNPAINDTITVTAYFLPAGNTANFPRNGVTFTVAPREMKVFDDVVSTLLGGTGLGAILMTAPGELAITSRIYADTGSGTLGQFVPGLNLSQSSPSGVMLQLKSNAQFRTNIGIVNVVNASVDVTLRLYDKNNAQAGSSKVVTMAPYGVIAPTNIIGFFNDLPAAVDLNDCWVSYTSESYQFAYASVIDNRTTDPTFIPAIPEYN